MADLEIYRNSIETVLDKLSQEILQRCKIETEIMVHNGRTDYNLIVVKKEDYLV
ncbi:MAG: hypothetical protein QNJ37_16875 [Crocosphaera sp.]|nr:hypothetical protein [Crocosphaera sp.]